MKRVLSRQLGWMSLFFLLPVNLWAADNASPVKAAFDSLFCPQRAPAEKKMGLLQRTFLDLVETSREQLQVAIVLDGTDSMAVDIANVRSAMKNMVEDLKRYRGDQVSFSLVVYRDSGAPSGEVSILLKDWTSDPSVINSALTQLKTETGAPYFLELPDLGIHEALDKLNWSSEPTTTRWLILFGDAPPYDADFNEPETGARRRYDTDLLLALAKRKQVQISCILSTSREEEKDTYGQVLDKTRQFMNTLSAGTGGAMLDLSYPDIQLALVESAKTQRPEYQPIGKITREDIEAARNANKGAKVSTPNEKIRLAILPHMPLSQISFDPKLEAVQIAAELRQQLRGIPGTDVKNPVEVERQVRRLKSEGTNESQLLQSLALRLRVDYVLWGNYKRTQGLVEVKSAIYSQVDGKKVIEAGVLSSDKLKENEVTGSLSNKLLLAAFNKQSPPTFVAAYAAMQNNPKMANSIIRPVAFNTESRNDLLMGFDLLEQSTAYLSGSPEAMNLLNQAEPHLVKAAEIDQRNPFAHQLLAQCHFNQAQALNQKGDNAGKTRMQQFTDALKRAFREKDASEQDYVKTEIVADYQLLVKKDVPEAIRNYEALTAVQDSGRLHSALRAHWVLAGIFSGDWGVAREVVNPDKARYHLIQILAHWPDSAEAAAIRRHLRWDEEKGKTQFDQFPRENKMES